MVKLVLIGFEDFLLYQHVCLFPAPIHGNSPSLFDQHPVRSQNPFGLSRLEFLNHTPCINTENISAYMACLVPYGVIHIPSSNSRKEDPQDEFGRL